MKDKKKQLLLSILGILSLVLITVGVTYAIFTYTRLGTTDNTITTGTLKFLYTENSKGGTGISITDAFPITDTEGKTLTGDNNVFDFKVEGTNTGKDEIPYEVTLRKKDTSTLAESNIKVYLTDMEGDADTEILAPTLYSNLNQTNVDVGDEVEKTIYTGSVLGNTDSYLKEFRLRMWVDENSNQDDINGKTFTATVNVYANVEVASQNTGSLLKNEIMKNPLIEAEPTLTDSSNNTSDTSGLYKSTATNSGNPTYYFRGNIENNYVSFAGQTWRVVRINEDGTIRMIMANGINDDTDYVFNSTYNGYNYMYYTNSETKTTLETWYTNNIANNTNYVSKVANGDYFCEQAKVKSSSDFTSGSAAMEVYSSYTPNFKCETDGNGKGIINSNIGLITYDEVVLAGGYYAIDNTNYYLYNNTSYWTMSPIGVDRGGAGAWGVYPVGSLRSNGVSDSFRLRPVLILNADVTVIGSGTSTDPWTVV